jgi:hypothetical protein
MLVHCPDCNISVECEEFGFYERQGDPFPDKFTLLKCARCFDPLLVAQRYYPDIGDEGFGRANILYPMKDFHINPAIPELLRRALFEVELCLKAGAYTSSVVMCRRALEGFAILNGVSERNLKDAILSLSEKEIINQQLYEWADQLRLSGNEAAHNIEVEFSAQDARDIFEFTIAILDFTYSYKIKFRDFQERKAKAMSK